VRTSLDRKLVWVVPVFLMLLSLSAFPFALAQQAYTPSTLVLRVYGDGVVQVEYGIETDVTYPRISVSLFGNVFEEVIIVNQDGVPLDYEGIDGEVIIDTLGAEAAEITYFTSDLTSKSGRIWVLEFEPPILTNIILPRGATIISLSQTPVAIRSVDGQTLLTMPAGRLEITYVVGVTGTREHALILINEAENKIEEIKAQNIIVADAETKLQEAKEAFSREQYVEAEQLASQAENLAVQIEAAAKKAKAAIVEGESSVENARQEGRTSGLAEAQILLQQAKDEYSAGNYEKAEQLASKAGITAESAKPPPPSTPTPTPLPTLAGGRILYWWIGISALGVALAMLAFRLVKKPKPAEVSRERRTIDVEKLFRLNPQLRDEDREAVQFIAECGGEAFEGEIRKRFKLPKTTVWRMMQRLEREGVAEILKIGGRNLIRIKSKYEVKGETR